MIAPQLLSPTLKMPTLSLPTYNGTGHVSDFLNKFYNFGTTHGLVEQQIILLLFIHLSGPTVEWYAAEVGRTPPTSWDQVVTKFGSRFGKGPSQVRAAAILSILKIGKGQRVADYFAKVMQLFKDRSKHAR